jgi:hypothetical protein
VSYTISFDAARQFWRVDFSIEVTIAEVIASDFEMLDDPGWADAPYMLNVVHPGTDLGSWTLENYMSLALPHVQATADRRGARHREAWVVADHLTSPIIRLWELLPEKDEVHNIQLFDTIELATNWLCEASMPARA